MTNIPELDQLIGKVAHIQATQPRMVVEVRILDLRRAYGRIDAQVTPISGHGATWVEVGKLTIEENQS